MNGRDDRAWSYRPQTDEWLELPDPGLAAVEGIAGVWTGSEAIFVGGYSQGGTFPGVAYSPDTGRWRKLGPFPDRQSLQGQELFWTGEVLVVVGGHAGPSHRSTLAIYDPAIDSWRESSPIPIPPGESLGADWTGTELILWGGFGTYESLDDGDNVYGDGAAYNPRSDTWRILAPSPLTDRCEHSATWTGEALVTSVVSNGAGTRTCSLRGQRPPTTRTPTPGESSIDDTAPPHAAQRTRSGERGLEERCRLCLTVGLLVGGIGASPAGVEISDDLSVCREEVV